MVERVVGERQLVEVGLYQLAPRRELRLRAQLVAAVHLVPGGGLPRFTWYLAAGCSGSLGTCRRRPRAESAPAPVLAAHVAGQPRQHSNTACSGCMALVAAGARARTTRPAM